jgi:hypothetical protein
MLNNSREMTQRSEFDEHENVSEGDSDIYEPGSPTVSGFGSPHFDRSVRHSAMDHSRNETPMSLEDFKDSEHLVDHILKQCKLEDKKEMLELVEKITDSIAGKPVSGYNHSGNPPIDIN